VYVKVIALQSCPIFGPPFIYLICVFRLEVYLSKIDLVHWPELVPSDTRGTRIFTAEQLSEISNQLEKFTSDKVHISVLMG